MLSSAPIPAGGAAGKAAYYGDLAREDYDVETAASRPENGSANTLSKLG